MQESIKRTLEANKETPNFIDALEKQNISIRVKTNEKKEIIGISYGIADRAFKGSSLGTNFTWRGLQKQGLNYEFERDYERLEEASRRRSRAESESAGSKQSNIGRDEKHSGLINAESAGTESINNSLAGGASEFNQLGGGESRRGKDKGISVARIEFGDETGREQSSTDSTSSATETEERFIETGDGESEEGNERQLRRIGQPDRGEDETARRAEPEDGETPAAEPAEQSTGPQAIEWLDEEEHFRRLERQREAELLNQLPISHIHSEPTIEPIGGSQLPSTGTKNIPGLSGAGNPAAAMDGVDRNNISDTVLSPLVDGTVLQTPLDDLQGNPLHRDDNAGSRLSVSDICCGNNDFSARAVGNSVSDTEADESVQDDSVKNMVARLRQSLEIFETMMKKTLAIDEALKAEEAEEIEIEEQEIEDEDMEIRILII